MSSQFTYRTLFASLIIAIGLLMSPEVDAGVHVSIRGHHGHYGHGHHGYGHHSSYGHGYRHSYSPYRYRASRPYSYYGYRYGLSRYNSSYGLYSSYFRPSYYGSSYYGNRYYRPYVYSSYRPRYVGFSYSPYAVNYSYFPPYYNFSTAYSSFGRYGISGYGVSASVYPTVSSIRRPAYYGSFQAVLPVSSCGRVYGSYQSAYAY